MSKQRRFDYVEAKAGAKTFDYVDADVRVAAEDTIHVVEKRASSIHVVEKRTP
jgi:hypothetical protein